MISFRRRSVTLGIAASIAAPPRLAWADQAKLTVILTNDIYQMDETEMADGKRRGGFARLAAVVKAERAKGGAVLFAHGGDTLSPSLMSGLDQGAHIVALTNMIKPDIFVPGNHEFDFGKTVFLARMAEAKFPLFAANLAGPDGNVLPGFKDRDVIDLGQVRIGLAGAAHDGTPRMSNTGDLKFAPTVAAMKAQAEALRRDGADIVIVVMHADREQGFELLESRAADLILTGHNHDLFVDYDGRNGMVESAYDAHYVTVIDLDITIRQQGNRREVSWRPQFRVIDTATVTPDPGMAAAVAAYRRELDRQLNAPLAVTAVTLDSRNATVRRGEAAIGNLIADAMRAQGRANAAIMNGGGIRGGRIYEPGSALTRRDLQGELPFGNRLVILDVSGTALRAAIENGLSRLPAAAGRFPQVSGLKIVYDPQRPAGARVLSLTVNGAPVDPNRAYRLAVNDFMARGGDDYSFAADPLVPLDDSPLLIDQVMIYLLGLSRVRSEVEGRVVAK